MQVRKKIPYLFNNRRFKIFILLSIAVLIVIPHINTIKAGGEEPRYGGWLTGCSYSDAEILNPILSTDSTSSYIEDFIFEGMMTYDKDMQIIPDLALTWEISPNKLDYTFHLREDVYWHDNEPFTADDVIFTWDRILDPRTDTSLFLRGNYGSYGFFPGPDIIPYEKIDDYTVVFHLERVFVPMLIDMMFPIIPKHIFEQYSPAEGEGEYQFNDCPPNHNPIGTGPMMFDEWIRNDQIILIRNSQANGGSGYWREHDAYLDGVIVKVISKVTTQLLALKNGEIDTMELSYSDISEIEEIQKNEDFVIYSALTFASDHIAFNCDPSKGYQADTRDFNERPNLFAGFEWQESDPSKLPGPNIRKALNYALDKDQLLQTAYPYGYRNLGPMYLAQEEWYKDDVNAYDLNIAKANELLDDAGFGATKDDPKRKQINFTICYNTGNIRRQTICQYAKDHWESSIGVNVTILTIEWFLGSYYSVYENREFDLLSAGWTGKGEDPDFSYIWHSKNIMPGGQPSSYNPDTYVWTWQGDPIPGGLNYMGYWNPDVNNLLNIAREEPEKTVRKMYYDQIQEIIVNDSPYIWLIAHVSMHAVRSNVHGMIHDSPAGLWPQPIGFYNVWKSANTDESSTTTDKSTSGSSTSIVGIFRELSSYMPYLLPVLIIGGFFAVGGVVGILLRKR